MDKGSKQGSKDAVSILPFSHRFTNMIGINQINLIYHLKNLLTETEKEIKLQAYFIVLVNSDHTVSIFQNPFQIYIIISYTSYHLYFVLVILVYQRICPCYIFSYSTEISYSTVYRAQLTYGYLYIKIY